MVRLLIAALLLTGIVFAQSGCNSMRQSSRQMVDALRPASHDDGMSDVSDPWIRQAGIQARGDRPRESLGEPAAMYNLLTSPKAREIDQNLGFYPD